MRTFVLLLFGATPLAAGENTGEATRAGIDRSARQIGIRIGETQAAVVKKTPEIEVRLSDGIVLPPAVKAQSSRSENATAAKANESIARRVAYRRNAGCSRKKDS